MKIGVETRERTVSVELPDDDAPTWRRIPQPGEAEHVRLAEPDPQRRGDERTALSLRVQRSSIDASRDPVTGAFYYDVADDDETTNLSRRGPCIRCERPPEIGSRVLVQLRLPTKRRSTWSASRADAGRVRARSARRARCRARRLELLGGARGRSNATAARSASSRGAPLPQTNQLRRRRLPPEGPPIA